MSCRARTRLWDHAAAYYAIAPQKFAVRRGHVEPVLPEGTFRTLLVAALNAD